MELTKKQPALLYLDKNGFYFYEEGLTNIISLAFVEESVRNLDVVNPVSLTLQIKTFIEQYQLQPASISIVLAPNVTFEKDVAGLNKDQQDETVKQFVETIPFDSVLSRSFPIDNGVKIVGCNEELISELKNAFEQHSCNIETIIPYQLMGTDQSLIKNLSVDTASQFLKRVDHLKQYTLLFPSKAKQPTPVVQEVPSTEQPQQTVRKINVRLYAMIGVFAVLFVILGFMLINMSNT